jgi:hypothetical protein
MSGTNYNQKIGAGFQNVQSSISDDYVLCNMCNRNYNEQAYHKHLPTCERKTNEANFKNKFKVAGVSTGNNKNINSTYCNGSKPNLNVKFGKK